MQETTIDIIKIISSILTPIFILIIGMMINKTIEKNKSIISKEKNFDEHWAMKLINISDEYNKSVTEFVANINRLHEIQKKQFIGWENERKDIEKNLGKTMQNIQKLNWQLSIFTQFCEKETENVLNKEEKLIQSMETVLKEEKINFDLIKENLCQFNLSVKLAHAELLKLKY